MLTQGAVMKKPLQVSRPWLYIHINMLELQSQK